MSSTQQIIESTFGNMLEVAKVRESEYAPRLEALRERTRDCETCSEPVLLDFDASLAESCAHDELRLVFSVCETCQSESRLLARLKSAGVPSRVRQATVDNYQIYDDKQRDEIGRFNEWKSDCSKIFLVLAGGCGTGKGHLAATLCRDLPLTRSLRWVSHAEFVSGYHSLDFSHRENYIKRFSSYDLLVFDELGAKSDTADTPELFYRVLDKRYDEKKPTVLIGNIPLRSQSGRSIYQIIGDERMESRMCQEAIAIDCRWPDFRRRKNS